jgi:hypothetical protein
MTSKILIVDPLTLLGRELLRCLEEAPDLNLDVDYRHTSDDDEHQIAELGAVPALVPPLEDAAEAAGDAIVVITSDIETERTGLLEELLVRHAETTVLDVGRLPSLVELTTPAFGSTSLGETHRHLRVAHPALVAVSTILNAFRPFEPVRGSVAAVDPVSTFGRTALEVLVHQAGRRMQGGDPDHVIAGHVLAFNQVAVDADILADEALRLLPEVPLTVTRTLAGCFHGHVAHLNVELARAADDFELREALEAETRLVVGEPPIALDLVADRDEVLIVQPQISRERRTVGTTAMVDGLRLGGATTAIEILRAMTVN